MESSRAGAEDAPALVRPAPTRWGPERVLRTAAAAEAVTWALLLGGIALRAADPALAPAVRVGGGLHGFVFLAYCALAAIVGVDRRWRPGAVVVALAAAVVPFATVPVERLLRRRGLLVGGWRTADDGDERTPLDALVRRLVGRPRLLVVAVLVAVAVVFAGLLVVGPPGR